MQEAEPAENWFCLKGQTIQGSGQRWEVRRQPSGGGRCRLPWSWVSFSVPAHFLQLAPQPPGNSASSPPPRINPLSAAFVQRWFLMLAIKSLTNIPCERHLEAYFLSDSKK